MIAFTKGVYPLRRPCRLGVCLGVLSLAWLSSTISTQAQPVAPDPYALLTPAVVDTVREHLSNPIVLMSIEAQNRRHANLSQDRLDALDQQWRAERNADDQPLIAATLSNPLSTYLQRVQADTLGLYAEIFVVDNQGINVGQSAPTTDYWQGDEEEFQTIFPLGPSATLIEEPEWSDDFQVWMGQINIALPDATGQRNIGTATIEFNLTELQRRADAFDMSSR